MAKIHRSTTAALVACLIAAQCTSTLLASDDDHATPPPATQSPLTLDGKPLSTLVPLDVDRAQAWPSATPLSRVDANAYGQWGGGFRRGRGRNSAAATAILLGAVGTIAGAAVLVYADRPDCSVNPALGGCGYGTKVIGGAVLSAGLVGLMVGALTWR